MIGNISSITYALPKVKYSVKDLCLKNGWDYKKLVDKTGVKYVYRSKADENALSLAIRAFVVVTSRVGTLSWSKTESKMFFSLFHVSPFFCGCAPKILDGE